MAARIGVLTPSSNTVLEPGTAEMLRALPGVSAHFARFTVTRSALSAASDAQFEFQPMLDAAELLTDAKVGVIAWSGTSASWLGFRRDDVLCERIEERTGIAACTAVGAINEILKGAGARRIALVTPYTGDVHERIEANYRAIGYETAEGRFAGLADNFSFATLGADRVRAMCREVASRRPDAIVLMCTNMEGWALMRELEDELDIAIVDSTAAVVWKALAMLEVDPSPLERLGSVFAVPGRPLP